MARPEKVEQVELLTEKLKKAKVAVLTDYRGLTVSQLQDLRARLRAQEVEYRVIKNTLARRAAVEAGHDDFQEVLKGPVAIAFGYDELGVPARLLSEYARQTRLKLDIVGGLVEGRVMGPDQVRQIAELPSREVLLAQLLGTLQSPVAQLVGAIQAPVQELVGLLEAYKEKLGGKAAASAASGVPAKPASWAG
jgi:large subunit ribosomal protein L10